MNTRTAVTSKGLIKAFGERYLRTTGLDFDFSIKVRSYSSCDTRFSVDTEFPNTFHETTYHECEIIVTVGDCTTTYDGFDAWEYASTYQVNKYLTTNPAGYIRQTLDYAIWQYCNLAVLLPKG